MVVSLPVVNPSGPTEEASSSRNLESTRVMKINKGIPYGIVPMLTPSMLTDIDEFVSPRTKNFRSCHLPVVRTPEGRLTETPPSREKVLVPLSPNLK